MRFAPILLVLVLAGSSVSARLIVHGAKTHHIRAKHPVKDVESHYHVSAEIMDLTQQVQELPEQTVPARKAPLVDLEEDEEDAASDPTRSVVELPEQTLPDPAPEAAPAPETKSIDLERTATHHRRRNNKHHHHLEEEEGETGEEDLKDLYKRALADLDGLSAEEREKLEAHGFKLSDIHPETFTNNMESVNAQPKDEWKAKHPAYPAHAGKGRSGVQSEQPRNGKKIEGGDHWASPGQRTGDYMPPNYVNPLLKNSRPPVKDSDLDDHRVAFDKQNDVGNIEFDSGDFHFNIHHNQGRNFLDANRVQIGTSRLGSHTHDAGSVVAKYRIRFANEFVQRPIVIVTTVPSSAEDVESMGSHPDVFVASVAEIALDSFVVNVVRVDSLPNNSWGQDLYLDWIAMEYDGNFPHASPPSYKAPYLQTYPAREQEEEGEDVQGEAEEMSQ